MKHSESGIEIYKHWIVRIYHWETWRHNFSKNESSHLLKGMVLSTEILAIILLWSSFLNFYFLFHWSLCNKQFGRNLNPVLLPAHSGYLTEFISTFLFFTRYTNFTHTNICDAYVWKDTSTLEFCWWVYENWWILSMRSYNLNMCIYDLVRTMLRK